MLELRYPLFDGERLWDAAAVTVEDGIITSVRECSRRIRGFWIDGAAILPSQ